MKMDSNTNEKVKFNLRGVLFETKRCTLSSFPNTLLASLDSNSKYWDEDRREYFFERDPRVFNSIINFYIMHELHIPKNICGSVFRKELEFWKISKSHISECCWKQYFEIDDTADIHEVLRNVGDDTVPSSKEENTNCDGIRYKIWVALNNPSISKLAMIWNITYMAVVIVSTLVFFLASLPNHRSELYLSTLHPAYVNYTIPSEKLRIYYFKDMDPGLFVVEYICMIIFTLELVLYVIVCPRRKEIIRNPMRVVTTLLIVSMWMTFIFEFYKGKMIESQSTAIFVMVVRFFTVLRVVLILRLERHFHAFRVLLHAIRASLKELFLLYLSFTIATAIFACAIFYAEIFYDGTYDNLFVAMWWAIITMTTVGYGDIYPTTTMGYVVGVYCAVCGIILLALPIAIIAANFTGYCTNNCARMRHLKAVREEAKSATC